MVEWSMVGFGMGMGKMIEILAMREDYLDKYLSEKNLL